MAFLGTDVLEIGSTRIGQDYVFGASVPLDNPNWRGPWDCAEFTSWCAYQAYGLIFGAGNVTKVSKADPYSGFWYSDARKFGTVIDWRKALTVPGAALIRAPATGKIGHVAFAMGDGDRTLEARGKAFGVGIFTGAAARGWSFGCLLPGVDYGATAPAVGLTAAPDPEAMSLPDGHLWLKSPNFKGGAVVAVQRALDAKGIDPGAIDGAFGPNTQAAVASFQLREGLEVDGVVGPRTAAALGLGFPIPVSAADTQVQRDAETPPAPQPVVLPPIAGIDLVTGIAQTGKTFTATTGSGFTFIIGSATSFTDDMNRVGLFQGSTAIKDSLKFGTYKGADFAGLFGPWAHFIEPTLTAEGNARFATLNTYDRAAFTFGAPQLAAHTPNANFITYLRALLRLPDAGKHFPDLSMRPNAAGRETVHRTVAGGFEDLEEEVLVHRPNGRTEVQLAKLMAYLNPSPTAIDAAELMAAARLMNWLRLDPRAGQLQIQVFMDQAKAKLADVRHKVPAFTGQKWQEALWIMDIRHQGRGTIAEIAAAFATGHPEAALGKIGMSRYASRIATVAAEVKKLATSGLLTGFTV